MVAMRLLPGQANTPSATDDRERDPRARVGARLSAVRGASSPAGSRPTAAPRPGRGLPRLLWPSLALTAALLLLVAGLGLRDLWSPPPAIARAKLPSGLPVRLVAVTRGARQTYHYDPRDGLCARLLRGLGARRADRAVYAEAKIPDDSVTLWLWIGAPYLTPRNTAAFADDQRREYRNGALVQTIVTGAQAWPGTRRRGAATLAWVSLTSFDHRAKSLSAAIPIGALGTAEPPPTELARFTVKGPGQAPTPIAADSQYPAVSGDANADLQLWQLRRINLPLLRALLPLGPVPQPADQIIMADVDVVEKGARSKPGRWFLQVTSATTESGERLLPAAQRNGLAFLSNGRRIDDSVEALSVQAHATKMAAGGMMLKFRQLAVPAERGQTKDWSAAAQGEPFPGGRFIARRALRSSEGQLRIEIEGHGPDDSEVALAFVDALDQAGRHLKLAADASAAPAEATRDAQGCHWRWVLELAVAPDSKWLGLACNLDYRAVMADSKADLRAKLQLAREPGDMAAWGVLLEPRGEPTPKLIVVGLEPGSQAANGPLKPGDELLRVDSMPAGMLNRALLRHRPGDSVTVTFVRDGQTLSAPITLDAAR